MGGNHRGLAEGLAAADGRDRGRKREEITSRISHREDPNESKKPQKLHWRFTTWEYLGDHRLDHNETGPWKFSKIFAWSQENGASLLPRRVSKEFQDWKEMPLSLPALILMAILAEPCSRHRQPIYSQLSSIQEPKNTQKTHSTHTKQVCANLSKCRLCPWKHENSW